MEFAYRRASDEEAFARTGHCPAGNLVRRIVQMFRGARELCKAKI